MYPAAAGQGLYEASTTRKAVLGSMMSFDTDHGVVEAIYVSNNNAASIAAGLAVGEAYDVDGGAYGVDTAALNNVSAARARGVVQGVLCAWVQGTATSLGGAGYAWAAYKGPITNAWLAASVVSNATSHVTVNSLGQLALQATSQGSVVSILGPDAIIGILGASDSTVSRASGTSGVAALYVQLLWR
jgi:hypothetical protein